MTSTGIILKMRRHKHGHGTRRTKHYRPSHSRHENKSVRVEERALNAIRSAQKTSSTDRPMPLIDIGIERIQELINSVIDEQFEDSHQDAWVRILDNHVTSEDDILQIARQVKKFNAKQTFMDNLTTRRIDKPLHKDEPQTLLDIIPSPNINKTNEDIDWDITERECDEPQYRGFGKRNKNGRISLDQDTLDAIKSIYPHDSLNHAIKKLALIPIDGNKPYALWEDAIIRQRYPWGGILAIQTELNRSPISIRRRASYLGVKLLNHSSNRIVQETLTQREYNYIHRQRMLAQQQEEIKQRKEEALKTAKARKQFRQFLQERHHYESSHIGICKYCNNPDLLDDYNICANCANQFIEKSYSPSTMINCYCPICGRQMGYFSQFELRKSLHHYCSRKCAGRASNINPRPAIDVTPEDMLQQVYYAAYHPKNKYNKTLKLALQKAREYCHSQIYHKEMIIH